MVDVIARAAVEIVPDVKLFARLLKSELKAVTGDIEKSLAGVDKQLGTLGKKGNNDAFKSLSGDIFSALDGVERKVKSTNDSIAKSSKKTQRGVSLGWVVTANGMQEVFAYASNEIEKANKKIAQDAKKASDEAVKASKNVGKATKDADQSTSNLTARLTSLAGVFGKVVSAGSSLGSLIPTVAAIGQLVVTASQSIAILPGVLATIGVAGLTAKLAFTGVADAIAETDPKKLAEEMKQLAPPAREFVKAVRKLKDEFNGVIQGIQGAFFQGLDHKIDALAKIYLPTLTHGLVDISFALNSVAGKFIDMLNKGSSVGAVRSILDSTAIVVRNLGAALVPIVEALLHIADVGADVFADLTGGAGKAAEKFRDFILAAKESGKLRSFIEDGIQALGALWSILKDIVGIVGNIFRPLLEGTGELQTPLTALLKTFREFTASSGFVDLMKTLGTIFKQLADVVGTVFKAALEVVLPILSEVLSKLSDHMAKIIPELLPIMEKLIGFFGDLLGALVPLLDPIFKLVQTLLPPLSALLKRVIDTIDISKITRLVEVISKSLVDALDKLAPKLLELAEKLGDLFSKLGPVIDSFIDFAIVVLPPLIDAITFVIDIIIRLINVAIVPLTTAWEVAGIVISTIWDTITNNISTNIDTIKFYIDNFSSIVDRVKEIFSNIRDGIRDKFQEAIDWVKGIPGRFRESLGDTGRMLYDAGANIVQGFINGITSKIQSAGAAAALVVSKVRGYFPFSPAKEGPLSGRGYVTFSGEKMIADFAKSLSDSTAVSLAVQNLTQAAQLEFARSSPANVNNFTTRTPGGTSGDVARQTAASAALAAASNGATAKSGDIDVHVFIGDEELTHLVTDVVVDRDRKIKRAVNAGGRRMP